MKRFILACTLILLGFAISACIPERTDEQNESEGTVAVVNNFAPEFISEDAAVVFSSDRNGNGDVYRLDVVDGTAPVRLTFVSADEWTTRGSATADGKFLIERNPNGYFAVYRFDPATFTHTAFLNDATAHTRSASFSPDGKKVVYSKAVGGAYYKIWMADADGKNARALTTGASQDFKPSMSAAGRIVFQRTQNGHSDLFVIDDPTAATVAERNLSATADSDEYDPVFSRTEEKIYFVQGTLGGAGRVSWVTADKSAGQVVLSAAGHYSDLALSRDGAKLAYAYRADASAGWDLYLAKIDGTPLKRLTNGAEGPR